MSYMLMNGRGTNKDEIVGVKWLAKAAEQGHGSAQFSLGTAYVSGTGTKQDYVQGYKWIALAVAQGMGDKSALPALKEKMTAEQLKEGDRLVAKEFKAASK